MVDESISQEVRLKNTDETRNCFIEEINQNELISKKHKITYYYFKLYWALIYFDFYNYWICFNFNFCLFSWYSLKHYKFGIKHLWNVGIKKYMPIIKKKITKTTK